MPKALDPLMFECAGPFALPCERIGTGRRKRRVLPRSPKDYREFWDDVGPLAERSGVYVFLLRAARGAFPWYVGKTTRGFRKEATQPHKLMCYQTALAHAQGQPELYLLAHPKRKGRLNSVAIDDLETELIRFAAEVNGDVMNDRKRPVITFGVRGVLRSGRGKPSKAASSLRRAFGI